MLEVKQDLYQQLEVEKEKGRKFTKEDLTYEILYKLAIEEDIIDNDIASLFDMSLYQVRNLRKVYDLQYKYARKIVDYPEIMIDFYKENDFDFLNYSEKKIQEFIYNELKIFAKTKKWDISTIDRYINEKNNTTNNSQYKINITNRTHVGAKKKTNHVSKGKRQNQLKIAQTKYEVGKLGEQIVYQYEVEKLKKMNRLDLALKVSVVTKTNDASITFDGAGYDIKSFNLMEEPIYIEVKCSITNKTKDIIFDISDKEAKIMQGESLEFDKEHCFIYYVYNVDIENKTADIFIIDNKIFSNYQLSPNSYHVHEIYQD